MLLQGKTAAVFAATGTIGSMVARRFVAEGARVVISGRNGAALKQLGRRSMHLARSWMRSMKIKYLTVI